MVLLGWLGNSRECWAMLRLSVPSRRCLVAPVVLRARAIPLSFACLGQSACQSSWQNSGGNGFQWVSRAVLCNMLGRVRGRGACAVWTLCFCPVCGARGNSNMQFKPLADVCPVAAVMIGKFFMGA
jgi:hypothetical protein